MSPHLLLLAGVLLLSTACSPGSSSPTAPPMESPPDLTANSSSAQVSSLKGGVKGSVIDVDRKQQVILLDTGGRIFVGASTTWHRRGDIHSFPKLASAFGKGGAIDVKANGMLNGRGDLKATLIKAVIR